MKALFLIALLLLAIQAARHAGEKPRLLVDAKATKTQAPLCSAPWMGPLKKPRSIV